MGSAAELRKLEKQFRKIPHAKAAIAYGSAVRGDKWSGGDTDIAVFLEGYYITSQEAYDYMSAMPKKYDITPHSVHEMGGLVSDMFNKGFYDHFMNHHQVIFDDEAVMKMIEEIGSRRGRFEEKVGPNREHVANISYYLVRARRGCLYMSRWLPKYGLIEPVKKDISRFKSSLMGVMRQGIYASDQEIPKGSDYKECVISKFAKTYPKFWNYHKPGSRNAGGPEFQVRSHNYRGFEEAPAYISSHMVSMDDVWRDLHRTCNKTILKQANECRKLIEFAVACVNEELMEKIS